MTRFFLIVLLVCLGSFWPVTDAARLVRENGKAGAKSSPSASSSAAPRSHHVPASNGLRKQGQPLPALKHRAALVTKPGATARGTTHMTTIAPPVQGGNSQFTTRVIRTASVFTTPTTGSTTTPTTSTSTSTSTTFTTPTTSTSSTTAPTISTSSTTTPTTSTSTLTTTTSTTTGTTSDCPCTPRGKYNKCETTACQGYCCSGTLYCGASFAYCPVSYPTCCLGA